MNARSTEQRRARPVADAPVAALAGRAEELAHRWAVALILARPLSSLSQLPLEDVARFAPSLCEALARALSTEEELERLAGEEHARAARDWLRALAPEPSELVADVEALRSIFWEALVAELRDAPARLICDLADRLSFVCARLLAAALEGAEVQERESPLPPDARRARAVYSRGAGSARGGVAVIDELAPEPPPLARADGGDGPPAPAGDSRAGVERRAAALRDERHESPGAPGEGAPGEGGAEAGRSGAELASRSRATPRARPWDTPLGEVSEQEQTMRVRRAHDAPVDERG